MFDSDVPGLSTGADTLEALENKLPEMIAELLELNADLLTDPARRTGPQNYRLVAHHEALHAIAA